MLPAPFTCGVTGLYGGAATEPGGLVAERGLTWGVGPSISWSFPNMAAPIARVHEAKAEAGAARPGAVCRLAP